MVDVRPFVALRATASSAESLMCPPYDVPGASFGETALFRGVTRPDLGHPDDPDPHGRGRRMLDSMIASEALIRDDSPTFTVHRMTAVDGREQTGIVAAVSVADYDAGVIRAHEHTRPDAVADRVEHFRRLAAHDEPVFLLCDHLDAVERIVAAITSGQPRVDAVAIDGVRHRTWVIEDPSDVAAIVAAFVEVPLLYIADGHHRSRASSELHASTPVPGTEVFPAVIVPFPQVRLSPYHRAVAGPIDAAKWSEIAAVLGLVAANAPVMPERAGEVGVYCSDSGGWYRGQLPAPGEGSLPGLDVDVLQNVVLQPILGVDDPRVDARLTFAGGGDGSAAIVEAVDRSNGIGFTMFATPIEALRSVADAGEVMPPKSTWFEPKPASGLVIHPFL